MQEVLDAPKPAGPLPDAPDQPSGTPVDARFGRSRARRLGQEPCRNRLVGRRIGRTEQIFRPGGHGGAPAPLRAHSTSLLPVGLREKTAPRTNGQAPVFALL